MHEVSFLVKPQNGLVWPIRVLDFSEGFRSKNWSWVMYRESLPYLLLYVYVRAYDYVVPTNLRIFQKPVFCTSFHLYVVVTRALDWHDNWEQAHQLTSYKKSMCQWTETPQNDLRPWYYIEFLTRRVRFFLVYLCSEVILKIILKKRSTFDHTKIYQVDLGSLCQELSVCGLGFVVGLSIRWQIEFLCASTGCPIQL